jgi:glyoxylase-like metal-dependent hydrolase (beta-lactamase superfamily II)
MSATIATRQFEHARVSVVQTALAWFAPQFPEEPDWRTADTTVNDEGMALMGVNTLVIETGDGTVVVDPSSFRPDETTLGGGSILEPGRPLDAALDELGIEAGDVKLVLVTHGHDDHFNGVLGQHGVRFANAEHLFPQADWDELVRGAGYNADEALRLLSPVADADRLRPVSGDVDLGDGLSLLHTPGETGGHQVVRLDVGDERLYFLGDLVHLPIEVRQLRWALTPRPDHVGDQLERSRTRVFEDAAAKPSTLVFSHGLFPAWGTVDRSTAGSWVWRYV